MINGRYHTEMKYHGKMIVIDAAYISPSTIEIMVMEKGNTAHEYEVKTTQDIDEAEMIYNTLRNKYSDQPDKALTGKYKQLRDDLIKAMQAAELADNPEDGGTCNFDAPSIAGYRWNEAKVKQAAKEAGTTVFKWKLYGHTRWVFGVPGGGQANRRSRKSEAMTETLKSLGYDALEYSAMD